MIEASHVVCKMWRMRIVSRSWKVVRGGCSLVRPASGVVAGLDSEACTHLLRARMFSYRTPGDAEAPTSNEKNKEGRMAMTRAVQLHEEQERRRTASLE